VTKVRVERSGERIWLRSASPVALKARIAGASYRPRQEAWTFPLRLDVCRLLRAEFPHSLEIGPDLWRWAKAETEKEAALTALGSTLAASTLERVPEVYPDMALALASRSYQSTAARFVAVGRSVGIFDTPGLGKTLESIAGIIESGARGPKLIVCPVTAMPVWRDEIHTRAPGEAVMLVDGSADRRHRRLDEAIAMAYEPWIIINSEMLRTKSFWRCKCGQSWPASDKPKSAVVDCGDNPQYVKTIHKHYYPELFSRSWSAIVMDECHDTLVRLSGKPTQVRAGARLLISSPDGVRIAASGTPMRGKPYHLFGILQWLRPKEYTGFWSWAENYFDVRIASVFGGRTIGAVRPEREAILWKALDGVVIRRTKAEVSPELPPKQYMGTPLNPSVDGSPVAVWLPMSAAQARQYREMQKVGSARVKNGTLDAVGVLAELTRLKQFATSAGRFTKSGKYRAALPSNKFDWTLQFLREMNIADNDGTPALGKVVIGSQFVDVMRVFAMELMKHGVECVGITGKIKGKARQRAQDVFNDPTSPVNVMFLQTRTGGVSITLDVADDMIILDEMPDPDRQEQLEERINNRRPEEKIATRRYWYLKSVGSIDEDVAEVNAAMDQAQKSLIDGRRGVAYARMVFDHMEEK